MTRSCMKLWWPYSGFLDWHLQRRWAWRPTEESRDIKVQRWNTLTPRWKPWLVQTWVVPFDENMRYKVFLQLKGEVEKMVHKENPPNSFWWGRTLWDITDETRGWLKWLPAVDNCRKRLKVTNRWVSKVNTARFNNLKSTYGPEEEIFILWEPWFSGCWLLSSFDEKEIQECHFFLLCKL